jgi:spore coat polysaccharide biosynthesis predicted glycosyltransferase SpsG
MKRLLILTEAGPEIGHGHLSRCRSLASAFGSRGYLIELFVDIQDTMLAAGESALQWNKLPDRLQASIRSADMVIVDSYIVGLELIEKIYDHGCPE